MNKTAKIIISVVAVFVVFIIFAAMAGAASDAGGHVPGIIGLILFGGLYGGLKAMWNKMNQTNYGGNNCKKISVYVNQLFEKVSKPVLYQISINQLFF